MAKVDRPQDEPHASSSAPAGNVSAPGATNPRPSRGRRAWAIGIAVLAAVALAAWAMSSVILSGSAGGEAALEQAQRAAAPGLDGLLRDAARRGQELDVNWTAVPDMSESRHLVTVRYRLRPSGEGGSAEFMVSGERVTPQGALARQLISGMGRQRP